MDGTFTQFIGPMTPNPNYFDSSYHSRHSKRAARKANLIAERVRQGGSILDIGCNTGLISKALLEQNVAAKITGVEIDGAILHPYLQEHPDFSLIEGEIQETGFLETYDSAIYFSVHHHVVAHHGIEVAIGTLRHIAAHCKTSLFFETGKIAEGSYWPWQEKLRRYFRFDEEHYCHVFRCLEDLIKDFRIIGYNRIHGVRREIFELRMKSDAERERFSQESHRHEYPVDISSNNEPETLRSGPFTITERVRDENSRALFRKSHLGNPLAGYRENIISLGLDSRWAVGSLGLDSTNGILFPFIDNIEADLSSEPELAEEERRLLAEQLRSIQKDLISNSVVVSEPFGQDQVARSLYKICDFNPSNLIVIRRENEPSIRVVDFAYQSPSYEWKNDLNFAHAFSSLGEYPVLRTFLRITGSLRLLLKLLGHQSISRKQRIVNRFPSLIGASLTEVASRLGAHLRRLRSPEKA